MRNPNAPGGGPTPTNNPNQNNPDPNNPNPNNPSQNNADPNANNNQNNDPQQNADPDAPDWDIMNTVPDFEDNLTIALINQDEEANDRARFAGENKFAEEIANSKNWLKNFWKGKFQKNYYRQKAINDARDEMEVNKSILLDYNEDERRRYNNDVCKTFVSQVEGVIDEEAGDERKKLSEENPELHNRIKDIISRYADGNITDIEDANRQFDDAIKDLETEKNKFGEDNFTINNVREIAIKARERFNKLTTVAEATKSKIEHDEAMERVMAGFDMYYGNRKTDHLAPKLKKVDKLVDKIQNSKLESTKLGNLIGSDKIALAACAAMSVAEFGGPGLAKSALRFIPGLGAAITSGAQESTEFERERYRANYDTRYNREYDETNKKREKMNEVIQEHHNASDLMTDLEDRMKEIQDLPDNRNKAAKKDELARELAKIKSYLDLEKTGKTVLSFTSELDAPDEQLSLLVHFANAKQFLKDNGMDDIDDQLDEESELMQDVVEDLNHELADSDKAARNLKIKRVMKRAAISGAIGLVLGTATQEVMAFLNPDVQGLAEMALGKNNHAERLTSCCNLAKHLFNKPSTNAAEFMAHNQTGDIIEKAKAFNFAKSEDGTYNLMQNGKTIAKNIDWDAKTGKMTEKSIKLLKENGIDIKEGTPLSISETHPESILETKNISFSDYLKENAHNVRRAFWYDNNTSGVFDQNELGCSYYTDPASGQHGFVTNMLDSGSFHGDKQAVFSQLAGEGKIKLLISATDETQSTPIEVAGKLMPNGQLSFVPEQGSVAEKFFDADGHFTGRFAEVVQDLGQDADGTNVVAPLATAVGQGFTPQNITTTVASTIDVEKTLEIPQYIFSINQDVDTTTDLPMIFPVISNGKPMPGSKISKYIRERTNAGGGKSYYGIDRNSTTNSNYSNGSMRTEAGYRIIERDDSNHSRERERLSWMGNISEKIFEQKELKLGEETARYRRELWDNRGEDYVTSIDEQINKSEVLKNLNNNIKTIVTIPVHAPSEYENIYNTLSLYSQQQNIDPNSFVILLDVNWREQEKGKPNTIKNHIDKTKAEIERARQDFPNLKIATIEQAGHHGIGDVSKTMNDTALLAIDKAIKNGRMSEENDILCIRNDADAKNMSQNYIASYQNAMKDNPKTPVFTGTTWFDINRTKIAPGFGAVCNIERMLNLYNSLDGHIHTAGANFAYRASHFAAVNAYGFDNDSQDAGSDDLAVGERLSTAFDTAFKNQLNTSGNPADKNLVDPSTRMLVRVGQATISSDDKRLLEFYAADNDYTTYDAYNNAIPSGYANNVIRPNGNINFSENLTDPQQLNSILAQFEREMAAFYEWEGGRSPKLDRIVSWWLGVPAEQGFKLTQRSDGTYKFELTIDGVAGYVNSLRKYMGTGRRVAKDFNPLQHAITTGEYVSPITP